MSDKILKNNKVPRLYNIGNSCYLNSTLQCLFNNKLFIESLYKILQITVGSTKDNLNMYNLVSTIVELYEKSFSDVGNAICLKQFLSKYNSLFDNIEQQDSHECLVSILDILHEETKHLNVSRNLNHSWDSYIKIFGYSFITDIFCGQIVSSIYCRDCNNVNNTYEIFNNIMLDLRKNITSSFTEYLAVHDMDDLITCDKCKKKTKCKKKISITTFPKTLIILLKRYNGLSRNNKSIELNKKIKFEDNINHKSSIISYSLQTVINHQGNHPNSGHYNTNIVNDCLLVDDDTILKSELQEVSNMAYLLVYNRN
jgi:ubiquitin C-terminal hydrolase